jgi:stearoyl-CoA desaturase (delta-9 desaturase)
MSTNFKQNQREAVELMSASQTSIAVPELRPADEATHIEEHLERISLGKKVITLVVVICPLIGLVAAIVLLWGQGFQWIDLALLLGMYAITGLGITVGFHRLFTHRAFETNVVVKFILGVFGSMAVQSPLLQWVAQHRLHHQHSDTSDDPHSPHHYGKGLLALLRGFWHAHLGWVFDVNSPDLERYSRDLRESGMLRMVSSLFPVWAILGLALPALLGGLLTWSWMGALLGLLWGGLARIFLVHHVTWSINSVCHLWGARPYRTGDASRNNFICGILAMGEGWHNNHHAFPTSARHGLRWWQFDLSYLVICTLALFGLAWKVKLPADRAVGA